MRYDLAAFRRDILAALERMVPGAAERWIALERQVSARRG